MGSLEERISGIQKRIAIDSNEEFVLDITHDGIKICDLLIQLSNANFNFTTGESDITLSVINPKHIGGKIQDVRYSS